MNAKPTAYPILGHKHSKESVGFEPTERTWATTRLANGRIQPDSANSPCQGRLTALPLIVDTTILTDF